jgi:membrane fusion protein (multidrug efflux system)
MTRSSRSKRSRPWRSWVALGLAFFSASAAVAYTEEAEEGDEYECLIEPLLDVSVSSAVNGVVDRVLVERGEFVKKGQVLVELVAGIETAAYELAKARSEFADRTNERNAELVEEKLISSNEKDSLETDALLARLETREALEVLKLRTLRSPISGVVADVAIDPGVVVDEQEMMRIAQLDPLNVEVVLPVALYGQIEKETQGVVRPEPPFERDYLANVVLVDRVVDAASGTFGVRLELSNSEGELPAGLKCTVRFPQESQRSEK